MHHRKGFSLASTSSQALGQRLREVREELFPEGGIARISRHLGIPEKTWRHYESGVTVPAHFLLGFIELTGVSPLWLLRGKGDRYGAPILGYRESRN